MQIYYTKMLTIMKKMIKIYNMTFTLQNKMITWKKKRRKKKRNKERKRKKERKKKKND